MPQVTIYLPADVDVAVRKAARRAGKSVSAYLADLAQKGAKPGQWPDDFLALAGSCDLAVPDDTPAEPVEGM